MVFLSIAHVFMQKEKGQAMNKMLYYLKPYPSSFVLPFSRSYFDHYAEPFVLFDDLFQQKTRCSFCSCRVDGDDDGGGDVLSGDAFFLLKDVSYSLIGRVCLCVSATLLQNRGTHCEIATLVSNTTAGKFYTIMLFFSDSFSPRLLRDHRFGLFKSAK